MTPDSLCPACSCPVWAAGSREPVAGSSPTRERPPRRCHRPPNAVIPAKTVIPATAGISHVAPVKRPRQNGEDPKAPTGQLPTAGGRARAVKPSLYGHQTIGRAFCARRWQERPPKGAVGLCPAPPRALTPGWGGLRRLPSWTKKIRNNVLLILSGIKLVGLRPISVSSNQSSVGSNDLIGQQRDVSIRTMVAHLK